MITGWYKPSLFHSDHLIFEVISELLTSGTNSRLVKRLVILDKLVQSIRSYTGIPGEKLDNTYALFTTPYFSKKYSKIFQIIQEEIQKLQKEGPQAKELKRVKLSYYAKLISSLESNSTLADSLSYYELMLNDYKYFFKLIKNINKISSKDIKRVLKKYFKQENNITVSIKKPI